MYPTITEMYEEYGRVLTAMAYAKTKDWGLAEDVVHDVFMTLILRPSVIKYGNSCWKTFLGQCVLNGCVSLYRKRLVRGELGHDEPVWPIYYSPSDASMDLEKVTKYTDSCSQSYMKVMSLCIRGINDSIIAEQQNISKKTVASHRHVARKKLKEIFPEYSR